MSPLSFFARHPRGDLSAYIDEQLPLSQSVAVETHLERCDSCRTEVAALGETRAAFQSLPQTAAPRSFALNPQHIAAPARQRPPERVAPAFFGMRLASGFAAAALAVVFVLDMGGGATNDSGGGDDSASVAEMYNTADGDRSSADAAPEAGGADDGLPATDDGSDLQLSEAPTLAPGPTAAAGGLSAGAAPTPEASPTNDEGLDRDDTLTATPTFEVGGDMATQPPDAVGVVPSVDQTQGDANKNLEVTLANEALTDDNSDGLSALEIAEIVLAATLAVAVAGGFLLPLVLRKNR